MRNIQGLSDLTFINSNDLKHNINHDWRDNVSRMLIAGNFLKYLVSITKIDIVFINSQECRDICYIIVAEIFWDFRDIFFVWVYFLGSFLRLLLSRPVLESYCLNLLIVSKVRDGPSKKCRWTQRGHKGRHIRTRDVNHIEDLLSDNNHNISTHHECMS